MMSRIWQWRRDSLPISKKLRVLWRERWYELLTDNRGIKDRLTRGPKSSGVDIASLST